MREPVISFWFARQESFVPKAFMYKIIALAMLLLVATRGAAQSTSEQARATSDRLVSHVSPPPIPTAQDPSVTVEVHGGVEGPLVKEALCPSGSACVFGLGLGLGVQVERRSADGFGLFGGYDFWVLDTRGVFEVGAIHAFRFGVRYTFLQDERIHPFADLAIGGLAFGDTSRLATFGGLMSAGGGVEVEVSNVVSVVSSLEAWFYAFPPFQTRDGVSRAERFGIDVALQFTLGVSILIDSGVVYEETRHADLRP